jgi:branched-chain amino acid transport system substrate-binding protein
VKLGVLHPVTGALSYSGQQGRIGAMLAVDEINAGGGIKALGGAKIDAMLGDQSTPDGGTAEVEKMNAAEVSCIVGGYSSSICLAVSQAAARYDLPYVVDVGVADSIVTRGLKNTFRFGPGFGVIAKTALDNLTAINDGAGKPAKTVMIVQSEESQGAGTEKESRGERPVLHLGSVHELQRHPARRRCHRARRRGRSRQDHCRAGDLELLRPRDALRPDQVRQRAEPGRGAG